MTYSEQPLGTALSCADFGDMDVSTISWSLVLSQSREGERYGLLRGYPHARMRDARRCVRVGLMSSLDSRAAIQLPRCDGKPIYDHIDC